MSDDLDQAYTRAHALAGEDGGPSATVRANVLAAARDIALQAGERPALAPVAAPVAQVDRGRGIAGNASSWRLRAGAAICAALVVGVLSWRWETGRQPGGDVMVASAGGAGSPAVVAPAPPAPQSEPLPPPVLARAAKAAPRADAVPAAPVRRKTRPEPEVVVAQAELAEPATTNPAAAPAPAPYIAMSPAAPVARAMLSVNARALPTSLYAAADVGDVDALRTLLAAPSAQVDAPDRAGGTALLHAVRARQAAAVRLLLAAGADPDQADRAGLTPRAAADAGIAALLPAPR